MSNFKQYDHPTKTRSSVKTRVTKAQQQWLGDYLHHLQIVEKCNQLIKEIFTCHKCSKRITNRHWLILPDPHAPTDFSKLRYYHSKGRCNPLLNRICIACGKTFRKKRKTQKYCSKKCTVKVMNSPILIKSCLSCGKEFNIRLVRNTSRNESYCPACR